MKTRTKTALGLLAVAVAVAATLVFKQPNDPPVSNNDSNSFDPTQISEEVRKRADDVAASARLTPGTSLKFSHAEKANHVIRFVYDKVFDEPRRESPPTIVVLYDEASSTATVANQE